MKDPASNPLVRIFMRAQYHPARFFNRAMYLTGRWRVWDWIDEHVLLGGAPSRFELRRLRDLGVRGIVNFCDEFRGHTTEIRRYGMTQLRLPTVDYFAPTRDDLLEGLAFMRAQIETGGRVYVHCKAGQGRSTTLVVCYLMAAHGLSARAAYRRILRIRPHVTRGLYRRSVVREIEDMLRSGQFTAFERPATV